MNAQSISPIASGGISAGLIRNKLACSTGALAMLIFSGAHASMNVEQLVGYAYDRASDKLIYTEQHTFESEGEELVKHQVDYVAADGTLLAAKTLDYRGHPYAPEFRMDDKRDDYVEGAQYTDAGYRLFRERDQKSADKMLTPESNLVADAGFDRYVRDHLDELLSGEQQSFHMAIAGHLTELRFRVRLLDKKSLFGVPAARFRVEPASLLRLIADPIDITYATETGRLLRYVGVTNIRNAQGNRYDARIDFPTNGAPAETETGSP